MSTSLSMRHWQVPVDHPAFDGHFPGAPVLPGAALLSEVVALLNDEPAIRDWLGACPSLDSAKFLRPALPGDALRVEWLRGARGVDFTVWRDAVAIAKGRLNPVPLTPAVSE